MQKPSAIPVENRRLAFRSRFASRAVLCLVSSLFALQCPSADAADNASVQHSFLGVGNANKVVIVDERGEIEWSFDMPASDGWVLPNGHVLLALYKTKGFPNGGVVVVERTTKKIVFQYRGQQKETSTVQLLPDGRFLVAELGPEPRAVVVGRDGEVVKVTPLDCQKENFHMQTRMLRLLPNGNYIAPHLLDFAVKEYDPVTGRVVRTFATDDRGRATGLAVYRDPAQRWPHVDRVHQRQPDHRSRRRREHRVERHERGSRRKPV